MFQIIVIANNLTNCLSIEWFISKYYAIDFNWLFDIVLIVVCHLVIVK